ncbi:MAG: pyruvate dehydrogenase complex dihydrolipoamide acetyltransferase [Longimonas sp.]|uniref:pyruvate dehydrogenase complex dihydrolipoamide acetyltransferase n=1 Tax=Longimonas sp. TaxID=2039626 RepID=UPI003975AFBE
MAIKIEMPKLSDTMEEGVLSAWLVDEGEAVSAGDILAQVETDKATMDLEAFDDGILLKKMIDEGEAVPIGQTIAVLGEEDEDISDLTGDAGGSDDASEADASSDAETASAEAEASQPEPASPETEAPASPAGDGELAERTPEPVPAPTDASGERVKASPLARRVAQEHSLDLGTVAGTGPNGRIVRSDVEAAIEQREAAPEPAPETAPAPSGDGAPTPQPAPAESVKIDVGYETESISQMRKAISRRLAQSKFTAPHFYLTIDVDMARAAEVRADLNERAEAQDLARISYNDLITKACALALREHDYVNASYHADEGEIRKYDDVHVGVAVAIDEGLITPVIRNADQKGLTQIAAETRELATKARDRELQPEEYEGATFTTSNLGMFGIEEFTAILNPPNAAILAIGGIRDEPVVEDGEIVPGKRMKVTLSCDHRVVDGAVGAQFLDTVRGYLEDPMTMLL